MSSALLNKNRIFLLKDKVEEEYMLLYECVVYKLFVRIFVKVCNNVIYKASQELRNYAAKHFQYSPGRLYPHNTIHRNLQFTPTYIRNGFSLPPLPPPPQLFPHYTTIILLPFCLRYFLSLCYYSPSKKNSSCPSLLTYFIVKSMHIFFSAWSTRSKYPYTKFTYICCYLYIIFRNNDCVAL